MNILFLTLVCIDTIEQRGIYQDLLRKFRKEGHDVTIVTPIERREQKKTNLRFNDGVNILQVKTFNITKSHFIEKGIGTLALEYQYLYAIKRFFKSEKFDLVLYSTPPITFEKVISFIKKRDNAFSYLLLKDIFPQNAVDLGMIKKGGLIHRFFRRKEEKLYQISDAIGCMSPSNVKYILKHNPEIDPKKVEVNPNSIEPLDINFSEQEKKAIRLKYGLPIDKKILVYGGNLGKPQGLDFLLETISSTNNSDIYFFIVGDGTEFLSLKNWFKEHEPNNAMLLNKLAKSDYDRLLAACDVGLIFLNKDFLIPNFPSRLLSYLEMRIPILVATDPNTDIGDIVEEYSCGYKVMAGNQIEMQKKINLLINNNLSQLGENSFFLLKEKYVVDVTYRLIIDKVILKSK